MDILVKQNLCNYLDEAFGASSIPLTILGKNYFTIKKSEYFAGTGVEIQLLLNSQNEIRQIQLGPDINIDYITMKEGLEFGLLGLLPVHTIQLDKYFDAKSGGIIRFGFLKQKSILKMSMIYLRVFKVFLIKVVGEFTIFILKKMKKKIGFYLKKNLINHIRLLIN